MMFKRRDCIRGVAIALLGSAFAPAAKLFANDTKSSVLTRIAFGSCAMQWKPQPIWEAILASEPDLFLFLGDAIYGDFDGERRFEPTRESLQGDWNKLAAQPGFQALRERVPVLATWDNHDYGHHNAGTEYAQKEMTRELFLDFFAVPEDSIRRIRDGIYDAAIFGPPGSRVQVILLDNRWNRDALNEDTRSDEARTALGLSGSMGHAPNADPAASLLGEQQWRWLEAELRKPAEVRLICSGTQVINDAKGMQEWGNFPGERERLFRLIESTAAKGVVLLSGNVHYSELSVIDDRAYPLYDFTSSGMTHNNRAYAQFANPYRVAGPYAEPHFSLVEIDRAELDTQLKLQTIGKNGRVAFEYTLPLSRLG